MRSKVVSGIMVFLLLVIVLGEVWDVTTVADPGIVRVPEDYPTIQEGINAANVGDVVLVASGTYYERVVVNKSLTLMGSGRDFSIIDGGGSGIVVHVTASNVTVTGFTIREGSSGILLLGSDNTVSNNLVTDNGWVGIYSFGSINSTISGNEATNNGEAGIVVEYSHDNIVVGNNATYNGKGIYLSDSTNCIIRNNTIANNRNGMYLRRSTNNLMTNNIARGSGPAVYLESSDDNTIKSNDITFTNEGHGVCGSGSNNIIDSNNIAAHDIWGFFDSYCIYLSGSNNTIDSNNITAVVHEFWFLVSGIYLSGSDNIVNKNTLTVAYYGFFWYGIKLSGSNSVVSNNNMTHADIGVTGSGNSVCSNILNSGGIGISGASNLIANNTATNGGISTEGSNNLITNNTVANGENGIRISGSNNTVLNNIATEHINGIFIGSSSNSIIAGNTILNNDGVGVHVTGGSRRNTIYSNVIENNGYGIRVDSSHENTMDNNIVANSGWMGIYLYDSNNSIITNHNITSNVFGIRLEQSSNNIIYHNNLIDNAVQAYNYPEDKINAWDNGYPSGGNYWSDYNGTDLYSGPYQNETGSDGIGDTPYPVPLNNQDTYPLMELWELPVTPPRVTIHDIAIIGIVLSTTETYIGQTVNITVVARNEGTVTENFNVTLYYDNTPIGMQTNVNLAPATMTNLKFSWNTTDVTPGICTIKANLTILPDEIDTSDNAFTDGTVNIKPLPGEIHDVAVLSVVPSTNTVRLGETVVIAVVVKNEGTVTETFSTNTYYDTTLIGTRIFTLSAGTSTTLSFIWETTEEGLFTIKAVVPPIAGENDTADNEFIDGTVRVFMPPKAVFTYRPPMPVVNQTVTFDASNSTPNGGTIISYQWNFGDGYTDEGMIVTHIYTSIGNYTVTLKVTDSEGIWSTTSKTIRIYESGALTIEITNLLITDQNGNPQTNFTRGDIVQFNFTIENTGNLDLKSGLVSVMILDPSNTPIFLSYTFEDLITGASKEFIIGYGIPLDGTMGTYTVKIMVFTNWPSQGGVGLDIETATFNVS